MAIPEYQIGPFRFLSMDRPMNSTHPRSELITRPGLRGGEIWRTKRQPVPFPLGTLVDAADVQSAYGLYRRYQELAYRDSLVVCVWADARSNEGGFATNYYVMDVQIVSVDQVLVFCGKAINPPSRALLRCEWLLCPFDEGYYPI